MKNAKTPKPDDVPHLSIANTRETLALVTMVLGALLRRAGGTVKITDAELNRPQPNIKWRSRHEPELELTVYTEEELVGFNQPITQPELLVPIGDGDRKDQAN